MQNTANSNETTRTGSNPLFARESRVGMSFLETRALNVSKFYKITGTELNRENKQGDTNDFWLATDLETGETGHIFIDGGLRGKANTAGGLEAMVGRSIELIYRGKVDGSFTGENGKLIETEINNYDMYFIKEA